jgi:hypothetical protein
MIHQALPEYRDVLVECPVLRKVIGGIFYGTEGVQVKHS